MAKDAAGFVTHIARNRRVAIELVLLYLVAFQILGGLALSMFILLFDADHLVFADPLGYLLRYGLPVFLFSSLYFGYHYRRHAETIRRKLKIRRVSAKDESRFVQLADVQCVAQGIRVPQFGILEVPELNALTVGEGPSRGMMIATRGLLDNLNDDELSAVFAHEAAHIRHGDTRLLALNHVFHRTAISLSLENPFRFDQWPVFLIIIVLPWLLPIFLIGHLATYLAMQLTYRTRQLLSIRRDYLADAAAVRATHDPAALVSAIRKAAGRGEFGGATRVAGLLFDSRVESDGYKTVPVEDRIAAITRLSGELMTMPRTRLDTRQRKFGLAPTPSLRPVPTEPWRRYGPDGRPLAKPPRPDTPVIKLYFTDRPLFHEWVDAVHAYWEWRPSDRRIVGLKPAMITPLLATIVFIGVFRWPADGNWRSATAMFDPGQFVEMGKKYGIGAGPVCEGPSYPDGKCPE